MKISIFSLLFFKDENLRLDSICSFSLMYVCVCVFWMFFVGGVGGCYSKMWEWFLIEHIAAAVWAQTILNTILDKINKN